MKNASSSDSAGIFTEDKDLLPEEVASLFPAGDSISPDCVGRNWLDGVVSLLQVDEKKEQSVEIYESRESERARERERN